MNYNTNFFDELLFATLAPIALALLLAIGDVVYTWRQRNPDFQFCPRWCDPSNARSPPAIKRMTGQLSKGSKLVASVGRGITVATGSSHAPFISAGILLTYLVLPAVSSKIMNTFRCSEVRGQIHFPLSDGSITTYLPTRSPNRHLFVVRSMKLTMRSRVQSRT